MVEVKDVTGVIAQISGLTTKEVTSKKDGKKYKLFSIGILLDDDESWHNISGFKQDKVEEVLKSIDLDRNFEPGDQVKIYEESKDNQFWSIKAITSIGPKEEYLEEPAPVKKLEELDMSNIEVDSEPKVTAEKAESKTVSDYKIAEANKFSLGMALNNAAVILAGYSKKIEIGDLKLTEGLPVDKLIDEIYPLLVNKLYDYNVKIRKEKLGY